MKVLATKFLHQLSNSCKNYQNFKFVCHRVNGKQTCTFVCHRSDKPESHNVYHSDLCNTSNRNCTVGTTFADVKPIVVKIQSSALKQAVNLLNIPRLDLDEKTEYSNPLNNANDPFKQNNELLSLKCTKGSFGTLTYAGKRWYSQESTKDDKPISDSPNSSDTSGNAPESKVAQLKNIFKVYGPIGFLFHIIISLASLGIIYLIVSSGLDIVGLFTKMGFDMSGMAGGASIMVVTYTLHKLILPLRATITIGSVPVLVRYLRKAGYLKK